MEARYRWEHQLQRLDRVLEAVTGKCSPEAAPLAQRSPKLGSFDINVAEFVDVKSLRANN
jgi:hypothetical protein